MEIKTIGVIGGGTMGNGIAHVAARSGLRVILHDIEKPRLEDAMATIAKNLEREVAKKKISLDDETSSLARIQPAAKSAALAEADFVIEAVNEDTAVKLEVFDD